MDKTIRISIILIIVLLVGLLYKSALATSVVPPQVVLQHELNSCKDDLDLELNYVKQLQDMRSGYEVQLLKDEKQIYQLQHPSPTPTSISTPTPAPTIVPAIVKSKLPPVHHIVPPKSVTHVPNDVGLGNGWH